MSSFKIECIENILGRKNNIVLFDIGAHNFLDSIGFKKYLVNSEVYGFRPDIIFAETCEYDNYTNSGSLESFDDLMFEYGYRISDRLEYDTLYIKL